MNRRSLFPALIAFLGLSGAFQINIVQINPSTSVRVIVGVITVLVVAVSVLITRRLPPANSSMLQPQFANPAWGRLDWRAQRKRMVVTVADMPSIWRDVDVHVDMTVENPLRRRLATIEIPLLGDGIVRKEDLNLKVRVADGPEVEPRVTLADPHSPTVYIDLPAPGLAQGATVDVSLKYHWPALAHIAEGHWSMAAKTVRLGGELELIAQYPRGNPQVAHVRHNCRFLALEWDAARGLLASTSDTRCETLRYTTVKGRFDQVVIMDLRARVDDSDSGPA